MLDHDKSTTITIGSSTTVNSSSINNLINNTNSNLINDESSSKESNKLSNGFEIIERNVIYIMEQLNYIIRTRFQTSTTLFTPAICFILIFVYILNLFSSPRASTNDKTSDDFHQTETIISSTLTLVPGKLNLKFKISSNVTINNYSLYFTGNILAPNYFLSSCIAFLSYPFVEFHWYSVVNDIIVITLCTNLIEPLFGRKELVTFFFVVNIFVAFFTCIHYICCYSIYGDAKYLYNVRLYGKLI